MHKKWNALPWIVRFIISMVATAVAIVGFMYISMGMPGLDEILHNLSLAILIPATAFVAVLIGIAIWLDKKKKRKRERSDEENP